MKPKTKTKDRHTHECAICGGKFVCGFARDDAADEAEQRCDDCANGMKERCGR